MRVTDPPRDPLCEKHAGHAQLTCGRRSAATSDASRFKYVTKRYLPGGRVRWMAQPSRNTQKVFSTQAAAAAWVAQVRKTSVGELRKVKSEAFTCVQLRCRLKAIATVYAQGREGPGDSEDLMKNAPLHAAAFDREPALEFLYIQGKYGPFREALARAAKRAKVGPRSTVQGRAQALHGILRDAVAASSNRPGDFEVWVQCCGRNVSHHSGFVPLCQRLSIIKKSPPKCKGAFWLSSGTEQYVYCNGPSEKAQALVQLQHVIAFMDKVHRSKVRGPRSCSEWCARYRQIEDMARTSPAPGMNAVRGYVAQCTIRALLAVRMARERIGSLQVDPGARWRDFAGACPDSKAMMQKVVGARPGPLRGMTVERALQLAEYEGPPQLLSMYLCFLHSVADCSTEFLTEHTGAMAAFRAKYKSQHGLNPVFADVVAAVARP